nr:MAG TPA: hypothetical protein [Bacteriophage sp.]
MSRLPEKHENETARSQPYCIATLRRSPRAQAKINSVTALSQ